MTRAQFKERWLQEHTKLLSKLPGCLEEQPEDQGGEPIYDGTAELWWESLEGMEDCFRTDVAKIAGEDADSFCDVRIHLYAEEFSVVKNGQAVQPPQPVTES